MDIFRVTKIFVACFTERRTRGVVGGGGNAAPASADDDDIWPLDTFSVVTETGRCCCADAASGARLRSLLSRVLELDRLNMPESRPFRLPLLER